MAEFKISETSHARSRQAATKRLPGIQSVTAGRPRLTRVTRPEPGSTGTPLAHQIDRYLRRMAKRKLPDRQLREIESVLHTFLLGVIGDKLVAEVDCADRDAVVQALRQYPAAASTNPAFKGLAVREAIDLAAARGITPLSPSTAEKYLGRIRAFFVDADASGLLTSDDPFFDAKIVRGRQKRTTEPFNESDLRRIFDPVLRRAVCRAEPHKFWTPLLLLYGQMEVIEMAHLLVDDIQCVDGRWVFRIGGNSPRLVPVHPLLLELGLLEYVDDLRRWRFTRLFPTLPYSRNHGYAVGIVAWFNNRFLRPARGEAGQARRAGIDAPNKSLSSFRLLADKRLGEIERSLKPAAMSARQAHPDTSRATPSRPRAGLDEQAQLLARLSFVLPTFDRYEPGQCDNHFEAFLKNPPLAVQP